jgi:WD40 repeat protein
MDAKARQMTPPFLAHTRPISALVFSHDGRHLASASWDRHVTLWRVDECLVSNPLGSHGDIVSGCRFSPDGKRLISWSYDHTVKVWEINTKRQLWQLTGHLDRVTAGGVSPDGRWLLTGDRRGEIRLWELKYGQPANSVPLQAEIRACLFLLDAATVVVVDANGRLTAHQIPNLQIVDEHSLLQPVQAAELAPSGAQIALGCTDGLVRFVAVEGYDSTPLAITAVQTTRTSANMLQRLFRQHRIHSVFECTCPACRATFDIPLRQKNEAVNCPKCHRTIRICAINEAAFIAS